MSRITDRIERIFRRDNLGAGDVRYVGFGPGSQLNAAGVTSQTAIGLSAVWRCLDVLAIGVQQLPWNEMQGNLELGESRLIKRPQAEKTRREWTSQVVRTMALYDVCYNLRIGSDAEGVPMSLVPVWPNMISPLYQDNLWYGFVPPKEYWVGQRKVPAEDLLIIRRGPSPDVPDWYAGVIRLARITFSAALSSEAYASKYWQSGGPPTTELQTEQVLPQAEIDRLKDDWKQSRSYGPDNPAVLTGGVKANRSGADPTAESAVEARRELVADIARYFGIPTRLVNAPTGDTETYTTTGDSNLDLLRFTLSNYIQAIEDAITDLLPGGRRMKMDSMVLTRGNQLARAQAWQLATGGKAWMLPEEVRPLEDLPPLEGPNALDRLNPPAPTPVVAPAGPQQKQLSGGQGG